MERESRVFNKKLWFWFIWAMLSLRVSCRIICRFIRSSPGMVNLKSRKNYSGQIDFPFCAKHSHSFRFWACKQNEFLWEWCEEHFQPIPKVFWKSMGIIVYRNWLFCYDVLPLQILHCSTRCLDWCSERSSIEERWRWDWTRGSIGIEEQTSYQERLLNEYSHLDYTLPYFGRLNLFKRYN